MKRPILYIAGPYTGTSDIAIAKNILAAREAAIEAFVAGWFAFTPHLNTAHFERIPTDTLVCTTCSDHRRPCLVNCDELEDRAHAVWLEGDIEILRRCADAICLLPGWEWSAGALMERHAAAEKGIPAFLFHGVKWPDRVPGPEEVL